MQSSSCYGSWDAHEIRKLREITPFLRSCHILLTDNNFSGLHSVGGVGLLHHDEMEMICMIMHMWVCITMIYEMILYTMSIQLSVHCNTPYYNRMIFMAHFSKHLKRLCSMLLPYTATMVWVPRFLFWNECYWFASHSNQVPARKDWEMHEQVKLLQRNSQD